MMLLIDEVFVASLLISRANSHVHGIENNPKQNKLSDILCIIIRFTFSAIINPSKYSYGDDIRTKLCFEAHHSIKQNYQ